MTSAKPALPTADPASPWMTHLERAHGLAHAAARAIAEQSEPSPFLAPAARYLERGVSAMYDAFDGRADRLTALGLAHGRLWEAAVLSARAGLSRALEPLRGACAELVSAEERYPQVPLASSASFAPPAPVQLCASLDAPSLHAVPRPSLTPCFRAPPEPEPEPEVSPLASLPEAKSFEDLAEIAEIAARLTEERIRALTQPRPPRVTRGAARGRVDAPPAPPPGFAITPPPPLAEGDFVRRWARTSFEEIGMLGLQRTPLAGDEWRTSLPIERRMMHALDALAALGPAAIASLEPLALDAPVVNPMTVFAITLAGGCLEGRDALGSAERVLHHFGAADPLVAEPFAAALKLAPNPFIPSLLRTLLHSGERAYRALAVDVLAHRGLLTDAELGALAEDDDPEILALALPALSAARHRDLPRALDRALSYDSLRIKEKALDAMILAAHPGAAEAARAAAQGPLGDRALVRVAIAADEGDARWLLDRVKSAPSAAGIEALGWAGLLDAIPLLIRTLESDDDALPAAAGAALDRLLGAGLLQTIEVLPDKVEEVMVVDPDPDPPKRGISLAKLVSHPRDMPSDGSPETLEVPSRDPAAWKAYWAEHGKRYDGKMKMRIRRGQGYSPSVSLYELDRLALGIEDRRRLQGELGARTGKVVRFDPGDLVSVQERGLLEWAAVVKGMGESPGEWGRLGRR